MTDDEVCRIPYNHAWFMTSWITHRKFQIKDATAKIKELADVRTQSMDDVDALLRVYHAGIQSGELAVGQKEALDRLLVAHREEQHQAAGVTA